MPLHHADDCRGEGGIFSSQSAVRAKSGVIQDQKSVILPDSVPFMYIVASFPGDDEHLL